ncbi:MAG: DUF3027 domain-containing protein [Actinobacteria bacterium]|jgi:hypothetical protein|nr:DUF3027 domain-containing protein [Actinomycetota bacterium]
MTPPATASDVKRDAVLFAAVDQARAAAVEEVGDAVVGDHMGVVMEGERLATHSLACLSPAYVGWRWTVTLARAPRAKSVSVNDVVLLPGPDAIVAPAWIPWSERVRPGDLGPGDVLPTPADDERLVAGLTGLDDLESVASLSPLLPGQWEIGLGRLRVLSLLGRDEAAERWVEGDYGPTTPMARQSAGDCATCGFMLPVGGPMGQVFAVCANRMSPADGRVVALTFGCGAHSEVEVEAEADPKSESSVDEMSWDPLELGHS